MSEEAFKQITLVVRLVLAAELFLGGQARLTSSLTPNLHHRAMAKAEGTKKYLSFVPISNPTEHTRFIGALMCTAGGLLSIPRSVLSQGRLMGGLLSITLTLAGVYSQYKMRIPYWLPSVNTVLAAISIWAEIR